MLVTVRLIVLLLGFFSSAVATTPATASIRVGIGPAACHVEFSDSPSASATHATNPRSDAKSGAQQATPASGSSTSRIEGVRAAKGMPEGATSQILLRSPKQLQSKFKHASDFGVAGNYRKATLPTSAKASIATSTIPASGLSRAPFTSSRSHTTSIRQPG